MRRLAIGLAALLSSPAALAQEMDHAHHHMGHAEAPAPAPAAADDTVGTDPAPTPPADHAADRIYPAERMDRARAIMLDEMRFRAATVMIDRLEYRVGKGRDGYAWEGEAWYGGDIDRLVIASEGEGRRGGAADAEVRALWRHAIDPWFDVEAGLRQDFRPGPDRSYAVVGIAGLAPYWFEVEGQAFLSDKGDVHLRAEASYDQRITQRLILQPRAELDLALQDVPELGIGSGVEKVEVGARLRYEFARELAPYVGVHYERRFGRTARFARAAGGDTSDVSLVLGVRTWF